jgi:hypothetical protein
MKNMEKCKNRMEIFVFGVITFEPSWGLLQAL